MRHDTVGLVRLVAAAALVLAVPACQRQNPVQNEAAKDVPSVAAQATSSTQKSPGSTLESAVSEVCGQTQIAIRVPRKLPEAITGIQKTHGIASADEYQIELYYDEDAGNAGFAGSLSGSKDVFEELPNTKKVNLANGITGLFRAVSCGGSCAPANLWWAQEGVMYTIQLKLPSDMDESGQESIMTEAANSAITVEVRKACPQ